jgi:hypothetical protein
MKREEQMKKDQCFKVKLTGPGVSLDRTVSSVVAQRIIALVLADGDLTSGGNGSRASGTSVAITPAAIAAGDAPAPKVFMSEKRPATDVERMACLAFYLSKYRQSSEFKTKELTDLNAEAAQPRFSNPAVAARNAVQKRYLALVGGGRKSITTIGEAAVEALPDRDKLKNVLDSQPLARHRRRSRRKNNTNK